jgi:class 3 adenylate cyclase
MSQTEWSDVGMSDLLPTGMVTLLLADIEGSTQLWETQPDEMAAAVSRLDRVLAEVVGTHNGVRPVEQGEGDSFVIAFARASDGVACALDLQRAPLAPIRLRVGVHTRRDPAAQRRQLHRADHQSVGAAARPGPRRPNRALGRH